MCELKSCDDFIHLILSFRVTVTIKRVGGAYGAKSSHAALVAAACSLAASITRR